MQPKSIPQERKAMLFNIAGRTALVTGAASGIGLATALELKARGAKIFGVDINTKAVGKVAHLFDDHFLVGDVTDQDIRKEMFRFAEAAYGQPVTIAVFSAGITRDALSVKMPKNSTEAIIASLDEFQRVLEVNLIAPVYCAKEFTARLMETKTTAKRNGNGWSGICIFLSSISAEGNLGQTNYAASKSGLEGAAKALNQDHNERSSIRFGAIRPGFTDTEMARAVPEEILKNQLGNTVSGRLHPVESVSGAICQMIEDGVPQEIVPLDWFKHAIRNRATDPKDQVA